MLIDKGEKSVIRTKTLTRKRTPETEYESGNNNKKKKNSRSATGSRQTAGGQGIGRERRAAS